MIDWVKPEPIPDPFLGDWIALTMFTETSTAVYRPKLKCFTVYLSKSLKKCSCDGIPMTSFMVNVTFPFAQISVIRRKTVFIVDTYDEAYDAAQRQCNCEKGGFSVFRQLDSNHYVSYFQFRGPEVLDAALLSRQIPTLFEKEEYEAQHLPEFKNKYRVPICTRRMFQNN